MKSYQMKRKGRANGFSLLELMVASTLGLLMSLAVARAFITTKEGFMMSQNGSQMQENGRFAIDFMTQALHIAGFRPVASSRNDAFPTRPGWTQGQVIAGTDGADSLDSLTVRFYGYEDQFVEACDGSVVPAGDLGTLNYAEQRFSVINGSLVCTFNGADFILVEGIEKLDILYGTDGDGDAMVDAYKTATEVDAEDGWTDVRAVKFFVIARSFDDLITLENARNFELADGDYTFNDNFMRDVFIATVGMRNILNRASSS